LFDLVGNNGRLFRCRRSYRFRGFVRLSEGGTILDRLISVPWGLSHVLWLHLALIVGGNGVLGF
jgi:hypothetical protein